MWWLMRLSPSASASQNGKPLVVKFAEGLRQRMEHKLYVANVPMEMGEEELTTIFAEHGEVKQLQVCRTLLRCADAASYSRCCFPMLLPASAAQRGPRGRARRLPSLPSTSVRPARTQLMRRPDDNASKGTALVRYSKRSEAIAAIAALNSTTLPGAPRPLSIKFAAEPRSADSPPAGPSGGKISNGGNRTPQNGHSGNGSGFHRGNGHLPYMGGMGMQAGGMGMPMGPMGYGMQGGGMPPPLPGTGFKLFVGMIPYSTGEAELQSVFSQFGPLVEVFMMREKDGRSKGVRSASLSQPRHAWRHPGTRGAAPPRATSHTDSLSAVPLCGPRPSPRPAPTPRAASPLGSAPSFASTRRKRPTRRAWHSTARCCYPGRRATWWSSLPNRPSRDRIAAPRRWAAACATCRTGWAGWPWRRTWAALRTWAAPAAVSCRRDRLAPMHRNG